MIELKLSHFQMGSFLPFEGLLKYHFLYKMLIIINDNLFVFLCVNVLAQKEKKKIMFNLSKILFHEIQQYENHKQYFTLVCIWYIFGMNDCMYLYFSTDIVT